MNISIFGLGYVGCVGMGCLAKLGHKITGVDVQKTKIELINSGKATIVEKDIDELIKKGVSEGKIKAARDYIQAVDESDVSFICVGTPNNEKGHLEMETICRVSSNIGEALKEKNSFHVIAVRSTVMPGTCEKIEDIIENESGKKRNEDFAVISNPEFLREGSAVYDFFNPPYILIAGDNRKALDIMRDLYGDINSEIIESGVELGEIIKLVNNSFHALKTAFANEVGRVGKKLGVDSYKLMDLVCRDKILNISPAYLKPGFAYGGSCLPKDLKAFHSIALDNRVSIPLIDNISISNANHIEFVKKLIKSKKKKKIGFLGISFKAGTDDLRFSPALDVVEHLLGKGYKICVYDSNVNLSRIMGKNKEYLMKKLPHITQILKDSIKDVIDDSEVIVVVNKEKGFQDYLNNNSDILKDKIIIDFTRKVSIERNCEGICW